MPTPATYLLIPLAHCDHCREDRPATNTQRGHWTCPICHTTHLHARSAARTHPTPATLNAHQAHRRAEWNNKLTTNLATIDSQIAIEDPRATDPHEDPDA